MKNALIIVDMLNDFVDGALPNEKNASAIISPIKQILAYARGQENWVVVFSNDVHDPEDREMKIWGPHAMRNTAGAKVISALEPRPSAREWIEDKHYYGAFDGTNLAEKLHQAGVETVYLTGQHTNCCVRHTAYGAFLHGFDITVLSDAVAVPEGADNEEALAYLRQFYGAKVLLAEDVLATTVKY